MTQANLSGNLWDNYSNLYNQLSSKMQKEGMDLRLLSMVIEAHEKVLKESSHTNLFTNLKVINRS